jgi:hypothetical protein
VEGDNMIDYVLKASLDRGWLVTIIYQKGNTITKRNVRVSEITEDKVKAFCYLRKEKRIFKRENILSAAFCGYISFETINDEVNIGK